MIAVTEVVQNEFFSITLDSFSEVEEFYVLPLFLPI